MIGISAKYLNTKEVPLYKDLYKKGDYDIKYVENTQFNIDLMRGSISMNLPPAPHEGCKITFNLKDIKDCNEILKVTAGGEDVFECGEGTHNIVEFIPSGSLTTFHSKKTNTGYKWVLYSCNEHHYLDKHPSDQQLQEMYNWYEKNKHRFD
jgi:hypothetical protein